MANSNMTGMGTTEGGPEFLEVQENSLTDMLVIEPSTTGGGPASGGPMSKPDIHRMGPSPLLARAAAFLPTMRAANEVLAQLPPGAASMEINDDNNDEGSQGGEGEDRQHIELDLGVGVFDGAPEAVLASGMQAVPLQPEHPAAVTSQDGEEGPLIAELGASE
ncbi:uncharacterized protein AMSG_07950 [Thecamonas trahens ATCC 50062]|uniref:Uncharacterized protein n=1 Tax=Thecamonas trahens ATCC 50062 TaxID=461836 RepID=A0A0L0DKG5_THETB|nr:hypothetical protein AMSG_07950 [Thecamonas trahens ATCC 50062]KNC51858.1 hypothetical protein AMSG_07950 [Thecamonas trahens ATCC 50062]|eukprot:XP_013755719.1 hypothetical protein AMSG_07950 [Thecamonas trahens ATCC 50062]